MAQGAFDDSHGRADRGDVQVLFDLREAGRVVENVDFCGLETEFGIERTNFS